jgi:hypothetical protein
MAINGDTQTAKEIAQKGVEVCKSTVELEFAICAISFMENKIKEGELLLRNLLEKNFGKHQVLFTFCEELNDNIIIRNILTEYN